jgi:hypothetical protein
MDERKNDLMDEIKDSVFSEVTAMDLFVGICTSLGIGLVTAAVIISNRIDSRRNMQLLMNLNNKEEL